MRSTFDIDLVLAMTDQNLSRFIDVAKRHGLAPVLPISIDSLKDARQIDQWHREKGMLAFALREPQVGGSVVDVLVRPEVSFEKLMENAVEGSLYSSKVWIAGIDDLLLMKRMANRSKDGSISRRWRKLSVAKTPISETKPTARQIIPEQVMLARLSRSDEMREFFIQMWLQNPRLAKQGGAKVRELLTPLEPRCNPVCCDRP